MNRLRSWLAVSTLVAAGVASAGPPDKPDAAASRAVVLQEKAQATAEKAAAEDRLQGLRAQLNALAEQQHEAESERSDASKALRSADNNVGQATRALHDTDAAIAAQQAKLSELEAQQAALASKLSRQRAELISLVRSAYAMGSNEQLKLLLDQDNVADLGRVAAYHRYLEQDRLHRIQSLTDQLRTLSDVSRQVDAQRALLTASHQQQAAKLAAVQSQHSQRSQLIASINASYHDRAARMDAMGRDAAGLEDLVNKLSVVMARTPPPVHVAVAVAPAPAPHHETAQSAATAVAKLATTATATATVAPVIRLPIASPPFTEAGGHFPWPIEGHIVSGFGDASSGLLISGTAGQEVHAVADGRVAFANWLKGYGLLVIVDHGNGLMSLYANNDALLKNAGDSVHAGEAVSTVGSSGGQGRNALYFEIRQNGKPVDPRAWLARH